MRKWRSVNSRFKPETSKWTDTDRIDTNLFSENKRVSIKATKLRERFNGRGSVQFEQKPVSPSFEQTFRVPDVSWKALMKSWQVFGRNQQRDFYDFLRTPDPRNIFFLKRRKSIFVDIKKWIADDQLGSAKQCQLRTYNIIQICHKEDLLAQFYFGKNAYMVRIDSIEAYIQIYTPELVNLRHLNNPRKDVALSELIKSTIVQKYGTAFSLSTVPFIETIVTPSKRCESSRIPPCVDHSAITSSKL